MLSISITIILVYAFQKNEFREQHGCYCSFLLRVPEPATFLGACMLGDSWSKGEDLEEDEEGRKQHLTCVVIAATVEVFV